MINILYKLTLHTQKKLIKNLHKCLFFNSILKDLKKLKFVEMTYIMQSGNEYEIHG